MSLSERVMEAVVEVLRWIMAGVVIAMVLPFAQQTNDLLPIAVVVFATVLIAAPVVMGLNTLREQV